MESASHHRSRSRGVQRGFGPKQVLTNNLDFDVGLNLNPKP